MADSVCVCVIHLQYRKKLSDDDDDDDERLFLDEQSSNKGKIGNAKETAEDLNRVQKEMRRFWIIENRIK